MTPLWIGIGAGLGGAARYALAEAWLNPRSRVLPAGTLLVNVLASFLVGLAAPALPAGAPHAFVAVGFCGALSTWSTVALQVVEGTPGRRPIRAVYLALTLFLGIGAAGFGWFLSAA